MLDYDPPLSWWANDIHDDKGGKEILPSEFVIKEIKIATVELQSKYKRLVSA